MTRQTLRGACVPALFATAVLAGPADRSRARIEAQARSWLAQHDVPSVAIAYIEHGAIAWTAVYGEQTPGVPATEKTLYNVASLAKPVSAEVVLRLASEGRLSLDEPMAAHWVDPDVKDNPWHTRLTPRLALSHQTGFTNWRYQTKGVLQFQWEPGTRTGYSGEGYDYVARYAASKTGVDFEQLARTYVFDPAGMRDTSYTTRDWFGGRLAYPHGPDVKNPPRVRAQWSAADDLVTTVGDYARFLVSVMQNERVSARLAAERVTMTRNVATPDQVQKVCAVRPSPADRCHVTAGMGLGWEIVQIDGDLIVRHSGSDAGERTMAFFVPKTRMGVVIFTNGDNGRKVIREIVTELYPNRVFLETL
jgi:CubicO group peptidase (beta-lactamase class C family)